MPLEIIAGTIVVPAAEDSTHVLMATNAAVVRALGATEAAIRKFKERQAAHLSEGLHYFMVDDNGRQKTVWTASGLFEVACGMTRAKNVRAFRRGLLQAIVIACATPAQPQPQVPGLATKEQVLRTIEHLYTTTEAFAAQRAHDAVTEQPPVLPTDSMPVHAVAGTLQFPEFGPRNLLAVLRAEGILGSGGWHRNIACKWVVDRGYFVTGLYDHPKNNGKRDVRRESWVTPKGYAWLLERLLRRRELTRMENLASNVKQRTKAFDEPGRPEPDTPEVTEEADLGFKAAVAQLPPAGGQDTLGWRAGLAAAIDRRNGGTT